MPAHARLPRFPNVSPPPRSSHAGAAVARRLHCARLLEQHQGAAMQKARYDQPLRKLRQVREELRQDYSRIKHDLARLEKMIAQLEAMNQGAPAADHADDALAVMQVISPKDIEGLSHAQAATLILSKASSPMTIRQLLDVFARAGRQFSPKNGYGILHKSLRNHKQFDSVAGRWRLTRDSGSGARNPGLGARDSGFDATSYELRATSQSRHS
jgi:hypothetical protein